MHKFQLVDFLINPPQKRYFLTILKAIDCQALLFRIFRPPLNRPGLSNKRFRLWLALLTQSNLIRYSGLMSIINVSISIDQYNFQILRRINRHKIQTCAHQNYDIFLENSCHMYLYTFRKRA